MTNEVVRAESSSRAISVFANEESFDSALRLIKPLSQSNLVPVPYRGADGMGNALIALDMANRMGISPIVVMQNLNIIEGRPAWSSKFIIGALGSCGLFSPIRWKIRDLGEVEAERTEWTGEKGSRQKKITKFKIRDKEFVAVAIEKATGEILEGPPVTFSMAIAEGWYHRPGSKWLTMPDLMGRYRSASFFGGLYAPHITNGMPTEDEAFDIGMRDITPPPAASADAGQAKTETEKPAGRAKGVHAAMSRGKAKPKEEAPVIDGEIEQNGSGDGDGESHADGVDDLQTSGGGDVFGGPDDDDDDYQSA